MDGKDPQRHIQNLARRQAKRSVAGVYRSPRLAVDDAWLLLKNEFSSAVSERLEGAFEQDDVRVFAMDETRFGPKSWQHRRWCPEGHRPPRVHKKKDEWLWLYSAVKPATGESFCLQMSHLNGTCFEVFLDKLREAYPDDRIVIVMDRAGAHQNKSVEWPSGTCPLRLPPRSLELNSAERWFREMRRWLSNRVFESIEAIEEALEEALRPYWKDERLLRRLTGYDWWLDGLANLMTPS